MHFTTKQKGILLMMTSALLFALMQIFVHITGQRIPLGEQIFFRNIVSLIICFVLIRKSKGSYFGERKYQPLLFGRSLFGLLGMLSLFYAAVHANQADITILSKLSPFLITLLAFVFLKEKISKIQIPALILAFIGAIFVVNPTFQSNLFPLFIAFLCAVFSSFSYTLLAYFKNRVDGLTVIMHFSTVCVLFSIPLSALQFVMPTPREFLLLLIMGTLGGCGQIALTYAYRMAPAAEVSIYNYSGIIFSLLLGYFLLGEVVSPTSIIGGALVIIASFLAYKYSNSPKEDVF